MNIQTIPDTIGNGRYTFRSYTRFTEDIQPASRLKIRKGAALNPDEYEIVSLQDNNKNEVVCLNTGDEIICFFVRDNYHGYDQVSIPVRGKKMVAKLHLGRIHLLFISGGSVHAAIETSPGSREFTLSEPLEHFRNCTHLAAFDFDGSLYIGVCGATESAWCLLYILGKRAPVHSCLFEGEVLDVAINGNDFTNIAFYYMVKKTEGQIHIIEKKLNNLKEKEYPYELRDDYYDFHLVPGGDIMYFRFSHRSGSTYRSLSPSAVCMSPTINRLAAAGAIYHGTNREYHQFFYTTENQLIHRTLGPERRSRESKAVLDWKVGDICLLDGTCDYIVYYLALDVSGDYRIIRLEYNSRDERWEEYDITLSEQERIIDLPCYTTEVTFFETANNRPVAELPVLLYADENILLDTPAGLKTVNKYDRLSLLTDSMGKIYFTQYCDSLYSVPVLLDVPAMQLNGNVIAIKQFEEVKAHVKGLSARDIYDAKKINPRTPQSEHVLDRKNAEINSQSIKSALDQFFANDRMVSLDPCRIGAYLCPAEETGALCDWNANPDSHWSITLSDGALIYQEHSPEEVQLLLADMQPNEFNGIREWFASIGEFFRAIGKAIVKVIKIVVDGIKAAVNFVIKGVTYVLNWALDKVSAVFDAVATVFAKATVYFLDLFFWLGFQVRWSDILRTKEAIDAVISLGAEEIPKKLRTYDRQFLKQMRDMKDHAKEWLNIAARNIGSGTLGDYQKQHQDSRLESAVSNNLLLRRLQDEKLEVCLANDITAFCEDNGWYELLQEICKQLDDSQAFNRIKEYIEEAVIHPEKLFSCLASTFVELIIGAIELLLDGLFAMFEKLLDMVESLVNMFLEIASAEIKLPFFSSLYRGISYSDLTLLDLGSLLIASITTVVYKMVEGSVPLANQAQCDNFIREINRLKYMPQNGAGGPVISDRVEKILGTIGYTAGGMAVLTGALDSTMRKDQKNNKFSVLGTMTLVLEFIWIPVSAPWFFAMEPHWFAIAMWVFFIVSFLVDILLTLKDVGGICVIYILLGVIHAAMAIIYMVVDQSVLNACVVELLCSSSEILAGVLSKEKDPYNMAVILAIDCFLSLGMIVVGLTSALKKDEQTLTCATCPLMI